MYEAHRWEFGGNYGDHPECPGSDGIQSNLGKRIFSISQNSFEWRGGRNFLYKESNLICIKVISGFFLSETKLHFFYVAYTNGIWECIGRVRAGPPYSMTFRPIPGDSTAYSPLWRSRSRKASFVLESCNRSDLRVSDDTRSLGTCNT